jgi:Ribonuclease G/E
MKGQEIILGQINGREAAARLIDGQLDDLLVDTDAPIPGTIYRAIADRPVKGQGGMFLRTPDGTAFLRQVKGLAPGDALLVQVTGYAEVGKAIPVTTRILFKSRYVIVTPDAPGLNISRQIKDEDRREALLLALHEAGLAGDGAQMGVILRSSCAGADLDAVIADLEAQLELATQVMADTDGGAELLLAGDGPHDYAWREWSDPAQITQDDRAFDRPDLQDALADAFDDTLRLPGAGALHIEPTRALVAVDVNTGADTSPAAGLKANLAAARALPRVLRLRGLGGQIVIDPAPMPKKDRRQFETVLRAALRGDLIETNMVGWTTMGLFELQRARARAPMTVGMLR